jgi:hypothetical protein
LRKKELGNTLDTFPVAVIYEDTPKAALSCNTTCIREQSGGDRLSTDRIHADMRETIPLDEPERCKNAPLAF